MVETRALGLHCYDLGIVYLEKRVTISTARVYLGVSVFQTRMLLLGEVLSLHDRPAALHADYLASGLIDPMKSVNSALARALLAQ